MPSPRLMVSWVAWYYDFDLPRGDLSDEGPNYVLYTTGFINNYDKHLLLSSGDKDLDARSELLYTRLRNQFPGRDIELQYCELHDILDFQEIKGKIEQALAPYRDWDIDILASTGATPMRMCWLLFHMEDNGYRTRLAQSLDKKMGGGKVGIRLLDLQGSSIALRLDIVQQEQQHTDNAPLRTPLLESVYSEAGEVARAGQTPVLIQGASGSGKEFLARHIHEQSSRRQGPFIPVNCAAIGPDLLESRLFGHRKGAFTGATESHKGFFQAASGGTLFLDEIGDISPFMQVNLLRAIQSGEITPVGETHGKKVDVRLVAATNKDLLECCEAGTFRWDLYYRLAIVELHLPPLARYPLAERKTFLDYFLQKRAHYNKFRMPLKLDPEVEAWFMSYPFPGNLRELDALVTRLNVFLDGRVHKADLDRLFRHRAQHYSLSLQDAEAAHIRRVLEAHHHNLSHTARALDIALNTLKSKLDRLKIARTPA